MPLPGLKLHNTVVDHFINYPRDIQKPLHFDISFLPVSNGIFPRTGFPPYMADSAKSESGSCRPGNTQYTFRHAAVQQSDAAAAAPTPAITLPGSSNA